MKSEQSRPFSNLYVPTLSVVFTTFFAFQIFAQSTSEVLTLPDDSVKVQSMLDQAYMLEIEQPDSAIWLYEQAAAIAQKIGYQMGLGRAIQYKGIVLSDQGNFDEAIQAYNMAIDQFEKTGYIKGVAATRINIGNIHQLKANYTEATNNYLEGIKLFEKISDTLNLIYAYSNLGGIFSDLEQFEQSLSFYQKSLLLSQKIGDSSNISEFYINLGTIELKRDHIDSASFYFEEARKFTGYNREAYQNVLIYNGLSEIETKRGNHAEALIKTKIALQHSQVLGSPSLIATALARTGMNFSNLNMNDSAGIYLEAAIQIATANHAYETLLPAYKWMSQLQERKGDHESALYWFKKYTTAQDSALGQRQQRVISGLEIVYETEKKDLLLSEQNLEIERNEALLAQRTAFIIALTGALLSAFIFLFLIRRSLRQKRIIAEKDAALQKDKVKQLEQENQMVALQSMMEGQEQERKRLARDLHDGLGGLLSSAKHRFSNILSENKNLDNNEFKEALNLLDNTSSEALKIAHNLMPAALVKFGLVDALRDFCSNVSESTGIPFDFQTFGIEQRLESSIEIMIYRIVQELVNNIVKHAYAKEAIVQLMKNENTILLTVEDDGKGFDPNKIKTSGAGMRNIQSRVDYLKGQMEIDSKPGEGSTFIIQIPIS